jgi:shikimate kinase
LKSSSAVSNAVALACSKLLYDKVDEKKVLDAGADGSIRAKVTRTGAYDDSSACYFGGFVVTDNRSRRIIRHEIAPNNLYSIIFLPAYETRKNIVDKLTLMSDLFDDAFNMALEGQYWKAMKLNGILMCAAYSLDSGPAFVALQSGALSCSVSGNGPAIAAVSTLEEIDHITDAFSKFDGTTLISKINNERAGVEELVG